MSNYYQMLGVRDGAHPAEIDLAFKTIMQSGELDLEDQLDLSIAHKTLLHPIRRSEYDSGLERPAPVPKSEPVRHYQQPLIVRNDYHPPAQQVVYAQPNNMLTYLVFGFMLAFAALSVIGAVLL